MTVNARYERAVPPRRLATALARMDDKEKTLAEYEYEYE